MSQYFIESNQANHPLIISSSTTASQYRTSNKYLRHAQLMKQYFYCMSSIRPNRSLIYMSTRPFIIWIWWGYYKLTISLAKTVSITKGSGDFQIRLIYIVAAAPVDNVCMFCLSVAHCDDIILCASTINIFVTLLSHGQWPPSIKHKRYVYYLPGGWLKLALYTMSHKMKSFNSI